jgi:GDP-L-fucose synthase
MQANKKIFLAGHHGMVGSAFKRRLQGDPEIDLITLPKADLDLTDQAAVSYFFKKNIIDYVILAAAKVGGINANHQYPADFIYQNLMIEANIIQAAHACDINELLFLGSSCIYPVDAPQPMRESSLLSGKLEFTNQAYAIAKIAGIELCRSYNAQHGRDYRCVMPTNLYGPNDNFHPHNSHVIPGLILKFHTALQNDAEQVIVWGSGEPMREFLHADDLVDACIHLSKLTKSQYSQFVDEETTHINIGSGEELSIKQLAEMLAEISGFHGEIIFDSSMPDGAKRKLLDSSRIKKLGWKPKIKIKSGLSDVFQWFDNNKALLAIRNT